MQYIKPNDLSAKNAIILIVIVVTIEIISIFSNFFQYDLLKIAAKSGEISIETLKSNDKRQSFIAIVQFLAFVVSGVMFILWFKRAYSNLHIKVSHLSYYEFWTVFSWFVPLVNLVFPFKVMKELYQETKKLLVNKGLIVEEKLSSGIVGWWWTFWIIYGLFSTVLFRIYSRAESLNTLISLTIADMILSLNFVILTLITIKVIKNYSTVEPLLSEIKD